MGAAVGAMLGSLWFVFTHWILTPHVFPRIEQSAMARLLLLRVRRICVVRGGVFFCVFFWLTLLFSMKIPGFGRSPQRAAGRVQRRTCRAEEDPLDRGLS